MNAEHSATNPPGDEQVDAQRAEAREALRQRLAHLFRQCDMESDSGAKVLFNAVLEYRLGTLP